MRVGDDGREWEVEDAAQVRIAGFALEAERVSDGHDLGSFTFSTNRLATWKLSRSNGLLWGWLKATAVLFPVLVVVLLVGHHPKDENFLTRVQYSGYEPVLIATDVENNAVANEACCRKHRFNV